MLSLPVNPYDYHDKALTKPNHSTKARTRGEIAVSAYSVHALLDK